MTLMSMNVADALLRMDEHLNNLTGARATLSKLAERCSDEDSELSDALFFVAITVGENVRELQRLWGQATDHKTVKD